jgi:pimeloyl-ACP methyl ester carboxylesterase
MVWGCVILLVFVLIVVGAAGYLYAVYKTKGAFFDANGLRLHYVEAGTGTPVILVHGLAINLAGNWMFPRVFQNLAKRYRVIALDNRGHGRSDKPYDPAQYGLELVEDIVRLMDHLGLAKAHVVGYSLGGFITLRLALTHPERLLSAAPCGAGWTRDPAGELRLMSDLADDLDQGRGIARLIRWLQAPEKPLPAPLVWFMDFMMRSFNPKFQGLWAVG